MYVVKHVVTWRKIVTLFWAVGDGDYAGNGPMAHPTLINHIRTRLEPWTSMNTYYVFEHRTDPVTSNKQYKITVVQGEQSDVMNTMINRPEGFQVVEICESLDKIMEVIERYMNMESKG